MRVNWVERAIVASVAVAIPQAVSADVSAFPQAASTIPQTVSAIRRAASAMPQGGFAAAQAVSTTMQAVSTTAQAALALPQAGRALHIGVSSLSLAQPSAPAALTQFSAVSAPQAGLATAATRAATTTRAVTASTAPTIPVQLSVGGMFLQADWLVKLVMIGLMLASLATWTVFIGKTRELARANAGLQREHDALIGLKSLDDATAQPMLSASPLLREAQAELMLSADVMRDGEGVKERIISRFDRLEAATARRMTRGVTIIATIGATAPFVGLFGTVWGIMNSFVGIAEKQTTNLAVVAPGIAEALLATALGLVAAIPAVVIYNHFARQVAAHRALLSDTAAAILRLVSRDISHGLIAGGKV